MTTESSNPSRRAELLAVEVVQTIIGSTGQVTHTGASDGADFRILYHTGTSGIGEVKLDIDSGRRAAWVALTNRDAAQCVALSSKCGTWSVLTKSDPRMKVIDRAVPNLISEMIGLELEELSEDTWPRSPLLEKTEAMGIIRINLIDRQAEDEAIIFPEGISGVVPLDSNSAISWIESYFAFGNRFEKSWKRLKAAPDRERHVFIWINDGSPADLQLRISFHPESAPTEVPELPSWLTHLWIGISCTFAQKSYVWLFQPNHGWSTHDYD